jgi:DNA-damage-inducible protein D
MSELINIEDLAKENGIRFWYAHELSEFLGYKKYDDFKKVIDKARQSTLNSDMAIDDDFISIEKDGIKTFKLTRFAVLMCALHANSKLENVQKVKVTLSKFAALTVDQLQLLDNRKELTSSEKEMVIAAVDNGLSLKNIPIFKDNGYKGMYNMPLKKLLEYKGISQQKNITLYDFMGSVELAANKFRAALTAEKIKSENIRTETQMYKAAHSVGKDVRDIVIKNTGNTPENLALENTKINQLKTTVKKTKNTMLKHDTKK